MLVLDKTECSRPAIEGNSLDPVSGELAGKRFRVVVTPTGIELIHLAAKIHLQELPGRTVVELLLDPAGASATGALAPSGPDIDLAVGSALDLHQFLRFANVQVHHRLDGELADELTQRLE